MVLAFFSVQQVESWVEWGGPLMLFALLFACGLGLPLPEDIPLTLGGYFVSQGKMNLVAVSVLAWCGIIGGDCVLYALGRRYGLEITRVPFIGKHVTKERILKAERLFERWGIWVVAVGRLFAGIRGAMVVAAGATRFSFIKFVIADGLAALISGGLFVALGYWLGTKLGSVEEIMDRIEPYKDKVIIGIAVAAVLVVLFMWWKHKRHISVQDAVLDEAVEVAERTAPHPAEPEARMTKPE